MLSCLLALLTPFGGTFTQIKIPLTSPPDGAGGFARDPGMPKRKLVEAEHQSERAKQRRALGNLRDLTVQPATRARYNKAMQGFFTFLKTNSLELPREKNKLDPLVSDYIEHLWSSGMGRAQANDTVAALQDQQPNLRGQLQGAWRLLKTWSINEVPNRAPPLPEQVLFAMAGWAFFHEYYSFGISLILGFYTMMRSGEIIGLLVISGLGLFKGYSLSGLSIHELG